MNNTRPNFSQRTTGAALVMVMWTLAALALFAAAMSNNSRAELKALAQYRDTAQLDSLSQAVMYLAAVDITANTEPPQIVEKTYTFEDRESLVQIIPGSGFINLNYAPESLLADLFTFLGGLPETEAQELARRVIVFRTPLVLSGNTGTSNDASSLPTVSVDMTNARHAPLSVVEDLLQIPGMPFEIFDKIQQFTTTALQGTPGVNPLCAPEPVLMVLAKGNAALASQIASKRNQDAVGLDLSGLEQKHLAINIPSRTFRIDVAVPTSTEGRFHVQRRWIELSTPGMPGLPVRTLRVDPPVIRG